MAERMAGSSPWVMEVLAGAGLIPPESGGPRLSNAKLDPEQQFLAQAVQYASEPELHKWAQAVAAINPRGAARPGTDLRDYRVEPDLWRSQLYPVSIDQAIRDGTW